MKVRLSKERKKFEVTAISGPDKTSMASMLKKISLQTPLRYLDHGDIEGSGPEREFVITFEYGNGNNFAIVGSYDDPETIAAMNEMIAAIEATGKDPIVVWYNSPRNNWMFIATGMCSECHSYVASLEEAGEGICSRCKEEQERLGTLFVCHMPFLTKARKMGLDMIALIANPDDCGYECGWIAGRAGLMRVFPPRVTYCINVTGEGFLIKSRVKDTILPSDAENMNGFVKFNDINSPASLPGATHESCFDQDIWEHLTELPGGGLYEWLNMRGLGFFFWPDKTGFEFGGHEEELDLLIKHIKECK